ncbi:RNA-binding domain-containing protein, partial [Delitschia confertaspora ATCC 74209]
DGDHIDQTAALLAGFESSEDEEDPAEDHDFDDTNLKPVIPSALRGELSKASHHSDEPGVVFVGRIPHGFYEHQMKSYFSQFGTITRLRLARNKKTGAPKHFAFIEFASSEVADIVAQTMDKYLLFGHILQCKVVPTAQIHPSLFKGANRRFKAVPRAKIAGAELKRGAERAVWEKRIAKEEKRRQFQNKKLKDAMDYEYTGPGLKSVDSVPKKALAVEAEAEPQLLTETAHQDETPKPAEIESAPAAIEKTKAKKSKKSAKAAKEETKVEVPAIEDVVEPVKEMKAKKEKKSKAAVAADKQTPKEEEPVAIAEETPKEASKAKKAKKSKALEATDEATPEKKRKAKSDEQDGAAKVKKAKKGKVSKA